MLLDDIEKKKVQVLEDHLKAVQLRYNQQLDYQKNNVIRRKRTHFLVQKGALFGRYVEEHLKEIITDNLKPSKAELLMDVFSDILKKNKAYVINQWNKKKEKLNKNSTKNG